MSESKKPFSDTKLGKFLKEKVPGVIEVVGDYFPPAKVISAIVGKNLPPEDQIEFEKLLQEHEKEMYTLYVQDRENARKMNVDLNLSDQASWLSKNTASLIALAYTIFTFVLYVLVLAGQLRASENISILIINSITNIVMIIIGFYYGSSERRQKNEMRVK